MISTSTFTPRTGRVIPAVVAVRQRDGALMCGLDEVVGGSTGAGTRG